MAVIKKNKRQRTPDEMLSEASGQCFSPPTPMYDAACLAENLDEGRDGSSFMYEGHANVDYPGYYQHQDRLRRLTLMQGSSNIGRTDGDLDYIGGVPDELMNGK